MVDFEKTLSKERQALLAHPLHKSLRDTQSLRVFMEYHVWAVYDFMCLAKRLQGTFTSMVFPWRPPQDPHAARLINEIILGEETDIRPDGTPGSHFELYLEAMKEVGANSDPILHFLQALDSGRCWQGCLQNSKGPAAAVNYTHQTLRSIKMENLAFIAGAFTLGRETLIPDLFLQFVNSLEESQPGKFENLIYYFKRHIELDGDEHGPLAMRMLEKTIEAGHGSAEDALEGAEAELFKRKTLWDAVLEAVQFQLSADSA